MADPIRLVVGLGNPGADYAATRHNAGFWWLERFAAECGARLTPESRFHALFGRSDYSGHELFLAAPQTFMNASGRAVAAIAHYYKIPPAQILLVYDELDLPPGVAKLKFGGGHGGHNGVKDTKQALASADFWRLRLGIGHPGDRNAVVDYVLKSPSRSDREAIDGAIDASLAVMPDALSGAMEQAMLRLHTKTQSS